MQNYDRFCRKAVFCNVADTEFQSRVQMGVTELYPCMNNSGAVEKPVLDIDINNSRVTGARGGMQVHNYCI